MTEQIVKDFLISIGTPIHLKGFSLLTDAIILYNTLTTPVHMANDIYGPISKKYGILTSNTERNIRTAILSAWNNQNQNPFFSKMKECYSDKKPTNQLFIAYAAEYIKTLTK